MAKHPKLNLKRKTTSYTKVLTDEELATAISEITVKYQDFNFRDIVDALDSDYREIFKKSKYDYHGLSTELGILGDVRIHFTLKGEKPNVPKI